MKKTVFCGVLVLAVLSAAAGQATRRQIKRGFLKQHNIARREETNAADMLKLKWDRRLAKSAQSYADQCNFAHSTTEYRQEVSRARWDWIGENIYITTLMNPDDIVDMAINTWKKEKSYYNYSTHTCQPQKVCGHYLQVSVCVCVCVCVFACDYEHAYLCPLSDGLGQHL